MFLIRNAEPSDFKALAKLAHILDSYNLPSDAKVLKELLGHTKRAFHGKSIPPEARKFLFVSEDVISKNVVGCSLLIARHGTPRMPHIAFRVGDERKKSDTIRRSVRHQTLKLYVNREGFTEIGGLVILPPFRGLKEHVGKQLSYARFAYMAWHPTRFRPKVLVEFLPELDPIKGNKFWDVLGARFTHLSYREADRLSIHDKEFILSLFPTEKLYCGLLPKSAIKDLGVPGPGAKASIRVLEKIGFRYLKQVDPFDGGPHYGAARQTIPIVRATRFLKVPKKERTRTILKKSGFVMKSDQHSTRALVTPYGVRDAFISLPSQAIDLLALKGGERVSVTPL